jgi:hypothetical protein
MMNKELSAILGQDVMTFESDGRIVVSSLSPLQILGSFKPSAKYGLNPPASWLAEKLAAKEQASAHVKVRRETEVAKLRQYLSERGLRCSCEVYPTSTGFSVCNLFRNGLDAAKELCTNLGIEYRRLEYSREHWVVRVIL